MRNWMGNLWYDFEERRLSEFEGLCAHPDTQPRTRLQTQSSKIRRQRAWGRPIAACAGVGSRLSRLRGGYDAPCSGQRRARLRLSSGLLG